MSEPTLSHPPPSPTSASAVVRGYLTGLLLLVLAPGALWIDMPWARFLRGVELPGDLAKGIHLAEAFAHGIGVFLILLTVYLLDVGARRVLPRMIAATALPSAIVHPIKYLVVRERPQRLPLSGSFPDSFRGWVWEVPDLTLDASFESMPSGHTATAVGLAVALGWRYPRGRWLFAALAVLAACQRMVAEAHFASDVLTGAGIGCLVATACLDERCLGRWFTRWEIR